MNIQDPKERHKKMNEMNEARKHMNSADFKYSMMPFSQFNNSIDVNLYQPESRIPYLFKDHVPNLKFIKQKAGMSMFFKCYSDEIYEAILEDLRSHYVAISNQDMGGSSSGDIDAEYEDENQQWNQ